MASRTTQTVVSFASGFRLSEVEQAQPAGSYRIDHDEESIEGLSWLAWRRTGSFIHLPAIGNRGSTQQMVPVSPDDFEALLVEQNLK